MISVICVYNSTEIVNDYLLKSLQSQTAKHELVLLDNRRKKYLSAATALNEGARGANGKYLMFIHQDVALPSSNWLTDVETVLDGLSNFGLAGVAGRSANSNGVLTNIEHGSPPKPASDLKIEYPTKVQTVDECLAIVPHELFKRLPFDEKACQGWHLYVVDYCLSIALLGYDIYVLPQMIYHASMGIMRSNIFQIVRNRGFFPRNYFTVLRQLLKKHHKNYRRIYTTCGNWDTSKPILVSRIQNFFSRHDTK